MTREKLSKTEEFFNRSLISNYEKKLEEINRYYSGYTTRYEATEESVMAGIDLNAIGSYDFDILLSRMNSISANMNDDSIRFLDNYVRFNKYIDSKFPKFKSLDFSSKISSIIESVKNNSIKLDDETIARIFYLSVPFSIESKRILMAIKKYYDSSLRFPQTIISALNKADITIRPDQITDMLSNISQNIQISVRDAVRTSMNSFFKNESKILKKEYNDLLREVIVSHGKSTYYKTVKSFDKGMDNLFPEYSYLKYDKKLQELSEKSADSFSDEMVIGLLYYSQQVSEEYRRIYLRLNSFVDMSTSDVPTVMEALSTLNIKLDAKDMINKLKIHNDFFSGKEMELEDEINFIKDAQSIGIASEEELTESKEKILIKIMPKAYGLVKTVCNKKLNINPYDVQLIGAQALNDEKNIQMYTGEGKSLTALFSAYLNCLTGEGVHFITTNDYLAKRDAENARKVLEPLGINVGCTLSNGQSDKQKKKVYQSDLVYGTFASFSFDEINHIRKDANMVFIDEADQVLIDDAMSPAKVETEVDKEKNNEILDYLETAYLMTKVLLKKPYSSGLYLQSTNDFLRKNTGEDFSRGLFSNGTKSQRDRLYFTQRRYYVVLGKDDSSITELGNIAIFKMMRTDEIDKLTQMSEYYFRSSESYVEGIDYSVSEKGITLTDYGLLKATNEIKEFKELEYNWSIDERTQVLMGYVQTQIKAFLMKKGENDNGYEVRENKETGEKEIVVLEAGRVRELSKYEKLHYALQLKEGIPINLDDRLYDSNMNSITLSALLSKYPRMCGMTGTADKDAFREIYNMETVEIPKNRQYQYATKKTNTPPSDIVTNPYRLYKDNSSKINAIVSNIIDTHSTGQPVLMITDDNEEAKLVYDKLKQMGYDTNLLISDKSLDEEAKIISKAGKVGAITIASEMAGRGTDIKLFGKDDFNDAYKLARTEIFRKYVTLEMYDRELNDRKLADVLKISKEEIIPLLIGKKYEDASNLLKEKYGIVLGTGVLSREEPLGVISLIKDDLISYLDDKYKDYSISDNPSKIAQYQSKVASTDKFKELLDLLERKYDTDPKIKKFIKPREIYEYAMQLNDAHDEKGLKLIQSRPFKTSRHDLQTQGRVGRQGEPGEVSEYASLDDLRKIGIEDEVVHNFETLFRDKRKCITDDDTEGLISQLIGNAQYNMELLEDRIIASKTDAEHTISEISSSFLRTRKKLLECDDITYSLYAMIDDSLTAILKDNVPNSKRKRVSNGKRVSIKKLNLDNVTSLLNEIFGIDISDSIKGKCKTVNNLKEIVLELMDEKVKSIRGSMEHAEYNKLVKDSMITELNNAYEAFMYSIESVRQQEFNDVLAKNTSHNRTFEVANIYRDATTDQWLNTMQSIFNHKKYERRNGTLSDSIETIEPDYSEMIGIDELIEDEFVDFTDEFVDDIQRKK